MEIVVFLIVLAVVLGYFLYQARGEIDQAKREIETHKKRAEGSNLQVTNLQSQLHATDQRLLLTSGEYQERERTIFGAVGDAAEGLNKALNLFPYIEDVNSLMARMSPEDMSALDLPWGHEYQAGMTQIAAQKGETIARLHEFGLKLALFMHYLKMTGAVLAPGTRFFAELLTQQHELLAEYAGKIRLPGFREQLAKAMAVNAARLEKAYLHGEEQPSEQMVDLFLQAIDEVASLPPHVETHQEQGQAQADAAQDGIPFPEEYAEYYGRPSVNGNGKARSSSEKAEV